MFSFFKKMRNYLIFSLPLNIWKLDAVVIFKPMYIKEVEIISKIAGGKNIKGLKFWLPRIISTSSITVCKIVKNK